jgi:predicted DNA-binding WGR domain protein
MKNLDKSAVLKTAEKLIVQNGSTTTLDVKNYLRNNGYHATQSDVSRWMDELCIQENWIYSTQHNHRVYRLGADTNDELKTYLEKGGDFWEIEVKGKTQTLIEGKIGTDGTLQEANHPTNRRAILQAQELIEAKKQEGFNDAQDQRLPLRLRQKFGKYFGKIPTHCTLGYYNVAKVEQQAAKIQSENRIIEGWIQKTTNAGFEFGWNLPQSFQEFQKIWETNLWYPSDIKFDRQIVLGAKSKQKPVEKDELSHDFLEIKNVTNWETIGEWQLVDWWVENHSLFKVEFTFQDGEKISLSKFDLDLKSELIPLVQKILNPAN